MSWQAKQLRKLLDDIWHVIDRLGFTIGYLEDATGLSRPTIYRSRLGIIDHRFSTVFALAKAVGMEVMVVEAVTQPQRKRA